MKFFTPEWEFASRRTMLGFDLKPDERAGVLDEDFFNWAYRRAYEKERRMMKGVHEVSHLDLTMRLTKPFYEAGEMSREEYETIVEDARRLDEEKSPFAEESVIARHQEQFRERKEFFQRLLPAEILGQVADIRVLAAGVASPEVFKAIKAYEKENDRLFDRIHEAYVKRIKSIWPRIPQEIQENLFSLHDATLERAERGERALTLFLEQNSENGYRIRSITFEDCEILRMDEPVDGGWWKYVEFDMLEDGRYEVGILLMGEDTPQAGDWFYQTIEVRSPRITFVRDEFTEEEKQEQEAMREKLQRLQQKGLVKRIQPT